MWTIADGVFNLVSLWWLFFFLVLILMGLWGWIFKSNHKWVVFIRKPVNELGLDMSKGKMLPRLNSHIYCNTTVGDSETWPTGLKQAMERNIFLASIALSIMFPWLMRCSTSSYPSSKRSPDDLSLIALRLSVAQVCRINWLQDSTPWRIVWCTAISALQSWT